MLYLLTKACPSLFISYKRSRDKPWHGSNSSPDSNVHGTNVGPTWVLSAPDALHVGPMNLANRDAIRTPAPRWWWRWGKAVITVHAMVVHGCWCLMRWTISYIMIIFFHGSQAPALRDTLTMISIQDFKWMVFNTSHRFVWLLRIKSIDYFWLFCFVLLSLVWVLQIYGVHNIFAAAQYQRTSNSHGRFYNGLCGIDILAMTDGTWTAFNQTEIIIVVLNTRTW